MATQTRSIEVIHKTDITEAVRLTITIGNLQIGGSSVKWETDKEPLKIGPIYDLYLGPGNSILDKVLLIETRFFDRNENTNNVSAMYDFNNGKEPIHVFYDAVKNEKDFFIFKLKVTFKNEAHENI
ncbi:hypothetical protein [Polluticaenibacter yanchengensis]|uniref:Uncharacterized protein n=1 Tax=Polluticaenibacter yanchengensis TaxID=3014562 RepID=A0ABT4UN90_9BACT|nr:hypothetical protein [Chitinophagaceae bacterium LY-5]